MQIVRRFDVKLEKTGKYVVAGGVAYNENFMGKLIPRGATNGHVNGSA
jgi:hypothetical protein